MALPKMDVPLYEVYLPIAKKTVKYRPFLVKEQKLLFMAAESDDGVVVENTIRQVLQNCVVDGIDIENLSLIDLEYFFIHLRAKSVGEVVESKFRCENLVNDEECGNVMDVQTNLTEITVQNIDSYDDMVKITDTIGVKMRLPKYTLFQKANDKEDLSEFLFDMIIDCIEYIYDGEQIYYSKDIENEELVDFLDNLNQNQFKKIQDFFDTIPKIDKKVETVCKKCGYKHSIKFDGLESFFA